MECTNDKDINYIPKIVLQNTQTTPLQKWQVLHTSPEFGIKYANESSEKKELSHRRVEGHKTGLLLKNLN